MHNKMLNDFSLRIMGKNFCDLSRDEVNELKRHPGWMVAAYGMSAEEFGRVIHSPLPSSPSAGSEDPIELPLDKTPGNG